MTEDDAMTKWCPFVRAVFLRKDAEGPTYIGNRFTWTDLEDGDDLSGERMSGKCIGSACMAWRSTGKEYDVPVDGISNSCPAGYCGLAGKP